MIERRSNRSHRYPMKRPYPTGEADFRRKALTDRLCMSDALQSASDLAYIYDQHEVAVCSLCERTSADSGCQTLLLLSLWLTLGWKLSESFSPKQSYRKRAHGVKRVKKTARNTRLKVHFRVNTSKVCERHVLI